jgi:hypothetical protein
VLGLPWVLCAPRAAVTPPHSSKAASAPTLVDVCKVILIFGSPKY